MLCTVAAPSILPNAPLYIKLIFDMCLFCTCRTIATTAILACFGEKWPLDSLSVCIAPLFNWANKAVLQLLYHILICSRCCASVYVRRVGVCACVCFTIIILQHSGLYINQLESQESRQLK